MSFQNLDLCGVTCVEVLLPPLLGFELAKLHQRNAMACYLLTQIWGCRTWGCHIKHSEIIVDYTKIMQPSISSKSWEIDYK